MTPVEDIPVEEMESLGPVGASPAAEHLLTLARYKTLRGITDEDAAENAQIEMALEIADDEIARYTGRDFLSAPAVQTRTYLYEGSGVLDIDDCTNVSAVVFAGRALNVELDVFTGPTSGPLTYWLDFVYPGGLTAVVSPEMGFTRNEDSMAATSRRRRFIDVQVTANYGWPEIPATVEAAAAMIVDEMAVKKSEGASGEGQVSSEQIADLGYSYQIEPAAAASLSEQLPPKIQRLLDRFQKVEL